MSDIVVSKKNESYLYVDCEPGILMELKPYFEFFVDGYKFMAKYKAKIWDGKISVLDVRFGLLPVGLYQTLVDVAKKLEYTIETKTSLFGLPGNIEDITLEDVDVFAKSLNVHSKGKPIGVRDYQVQSIYNCIKSQRLICISPTGSGKSLIAYILFRWYFSKGKEHFLLVVPNLGLLRQMIGDFIDYSSHNGFDVVSNSQLIEAGALKVITKPLIISTWQSIYKQPSTWLNKLDVILCDEAHQLKADAIKGIFERATEVKHKFGMTGSLDKSVVNKMILNGLIGEISKVKSTRDLINDGFLSDIKIKCIMLKYNKETKKLLKDADYQTEIDFLCAHKRRNLFIANLALSLKGNSLLLFNYIEKHGEPLFNLIKEKSNGQKVHFVAGKVEADDREIIRKLVQESTEDNIIVGSLGTVSTGINIPRLHNIIFATPSKSVIRVMQSMGRGLRLADDKSHLNLYDIADIINNSKSNSNYTFRHFAERLRVYVDEEHEYKLLELEIE